MDYKLFWGDMHMNVRTDQMEDLEAIMNHAKQVLDFFPIAYYPFYVYNQQGLNVETCNDEDIFYEQWEEICDAIAEYNEEGEFVTFPGFEWHGNRKFYGDHNVFYFNDYEPLVGYKKLEDLYQHLREHKGIAIPHHTAYKIRERGKDWNYFDPDISPVAEIFSMHGSSEGCQTPYTMSHNQSMGPRVYPGSFHSGLEKGNKFGFIGSGDNHMGVPAFRDHGIMGLYAEELSREAIWEAIKERRTYAVTGDRIKLLFEHQDGTFMGSETEAKAPHKFNVSVEGSDIIDRIDLIRNNKIINAFVQTENEELENKDSSRRVKLRLQFGWGPEENFETRWNDWQGNLSVENGKIIDLETGFNWRNQKVEKQKDGSYNWNLKTKARKYDQHLIFTLEINDNSLIKVNSDGKIVEIPGDKAEEFGDVIAHYEQAKKTIKKEFGLDPEDIENPDHFYHNAFKLKIHRSVPESKYKLSKSFSDNYQGKAYYYVRVYQRNGQMAWSSPIWIEK